MQSTKLIKLLRALNAEEFKRLGKFVKSDYFNTDKNLILFYAFLKKHYPEFQAQKTDKRAAFKIVFPNTGYNDAKMRNLTSKMNSLVDKYLVCLEWENSPALKEQLSLKAFENRGIDHDEYTKKTFALIDSFNRKKKKASDDYLNLFYLNANYYFNIRTEKEKDSIGHLLNANGALTTLSNVFTLKLKCELNTRKNITADKHQNPNKNHLPTIEPLEETLGAILSLQTNPSFEKYSITKKLLYSNISTIAIAEFRTMFQLLLNFVIGQHNIGLKKYEKEIFNLYKFGIEYDILIDNNVIPDSIFINIASQGSKIGEFEWSINFMEKHKSLLASETQEETISIGMGYWYFFQKKFTEAINSLCKISFTKTDYKVHSRWLLVRCYYELFYENQSYLDLTNSSISSFEKFLKRNKNVPEIRKKIFINALNELKKIIKCKAEKRLTTEQKKEWIKTLNNSRLTGGKPWLIDKINAL